MLAAGLQAARGCTQVWNTVVHKCLRACIATRSTAYKSNRLCSCAGTHVAVTALRSKCSHSGVRQVCTRYVSQVLMIMLSFLQAVEPSGALCVCKLYCQQATLVPVQLSTAAATHRRLRSRCAKTRAQRIALTTVYTHRRYCWCCFVLFSTSCSTSSTRHFPALRRE